MPNSRSDDSQDVGSSKDSQDGSQMLDSVKIQDLVDRHTASVSDCLSCRLVDELTDYCTGQNSPSQRGGPHSQSTRRRIRSIASAS